MNLRKQLSSYIALNNYVEAIRENTSSVVLTDAITNSLESLQLKGSEVKNQPETFLDSVVAKGKTEQRNLSVEYTQLEYIQSSGSQYIDIGRVPNNNDIIEQKFQKVGSSQTTCSWYGSMPASTTILPRIGVGTFSSNSILTFFAGSNYTGIISAADTNSHTLRFQATGERELTYTFDGVTNVSTMTGNMYEPAVEFTSYLFARHGTDGVQTYDNEGTKIYYHQEYLADGTLVLNMIPVRRNSDNVLGMYDTVSRQFFTNQGTGEFIAGPEMVPTPSTPVDIWCNNGVLKYGFNYYNYNVARQLSTEDYPVESGRSVNYSDGVLTCSITGSTGSNNGLYPTWSLNFTAGHKYASIAMAKGDALINLGAASIMPGGAITGAAATEYYTITNNYVWYAKLWECNTDASARLNIRIRGTDVGQYASFKDILVVDLTAIFGAGNEPTTPSDIIQSTIGIYTNGTVETLQDSTGLTAEVQTLFGIDNYQDTHSVLDGTITRNVGIKIFDGTETWGRNSYSNFGYRFYSILSKNRDWTAILKCNVYEGIPYQGGSSIGPNNTVFFAGITTTESGCFIRDDRFTTVNDWKQYLADQYANGTPVIVIYPLAESTKETVSSQKLLKNPVTVTEASIDNLEVTTTETEHTVPTPDYPLDIVCNNGVLKLGPNLFNADSFNWTFREGTQEYSEFIPYNGVIVEGTPETVTITGKNLLDINNLQILQNKAISNTGAYIDNPATNICDTYIYVKPNTTYTISGNTLSGGTGTPVYFRLAYYDSNKTFISRSEGIEGKYHTFTTDSNTNYIKFHYANVMSDLNTYMLEESSRPTKYEEYHQASFAPEDLLKLGNYQDIQDVINGIKSKKIGFKVFDGTENWAVGSSVYPNRFVLAGAFDDIAQIPNENVGCSNYYTVIARSTSIQQNLQNNECGWNTTYVFCVRDDRFTTAEQFTAWLADQYAAGTPVIIVYPLADTVEETVESRDIFITSGTNTIERNSEYVSSGDITVGYKKLK